MKNSAKILRYIGIFDLVTGTVSIIVAVYLYASGLKLFDAAGEVTATFIFMIIGVVFVINSPILFFVAKKNEEKNNSPVQY